MPAIRKVLTICSIIVSSFSYAQEVPQQNDAISTQMKKLAWLEGEWEGTVTMSMGPNRKTEGTVQEWGNFAAAGNVFHFKGIGKAEIAGKVQTVHDAFAVIWYDKKSDSFKINAFSTRGPAENPHVDVMDKKLVWGFKADQGEVTFQIIQDDQGRWIETGEIKVGDRSFPFIEMNLSKKK